MATQGRLYLILAILVATLLIRMHGAAAASGDAENGRLAAQARCTACHSVERETAGTGSFAPDFTVIARRRSALWLHAFLRGAEDRPAGDQRLADRRAGAAGRRGGGHA